MTDVAFRRSCQECAANRLDDFLQSGAHLPVQAHLIAGWEKVLGDLEGGNEPDTALSSCPLLADRGDPFGRFG